MVKTGSDSFTVKRSATGHGSFEMTFIIGCSTINSLSATQYSILDSTFKASKIFTVEIHTGLVDFS